MSDKRVIAVVGATGSQGGGLCRAILSDPESGFAVRALTRDTTSPEASRLAHLGAEIVQADISDPTSLKSAFAGAYGAFCVTFFWNHFKPEVELQQAQFMAHVAKEAGLKHVVWSTLEDTRQWVPLDDGRMPTLMGQYKVPHFDAKGEANHFFRELGVPTTFLLTSFYWDNLIYFGLGPKRGEDGKLAITLPMGDRPLPGIAAEDIGACAYQIFKKGNAMVSQTVGIAGDVLTGYQMAASLTNALGEVVVYNPISHSAYRSLGFDGAEDLGNMFQFKHDFNEDFCRPRNVVATRALHPGLMTFDNWLSKYKAHIQTS